LCVFGIIQRNHRRSQISRILRIRGVKLSVFAENAERNSAFLRKTWSKTVRFRQERRVKCCVSGDNADFAKILYVEEFKIYFYNF
jgi:hypothetical protein